MKSIINTTEFQYHFTELAQRHEMTSANWMYQKRGQIPDIFQVYQKPLFIGLILERDEVQNAPVTLQDFTFWRKEAYKATEAARDVSTMRKRKLKDPVGILVQKQITPSMVILDMGGFVSFMGIPILSVLGYPKYAMEPAMKEPEVLIAKNIKITKTDIKKVWDF